MKDHSPMNATFEGWLPILKRRAKAFEKNQPPAVFSGGGGAQIW
jgi:hypothetical protein